MVSVTWRSPLRYLILFCLCWLLTVSCSRSTPDAAAPSRNQRIVLGTAAPTVSTLDPADAYSIFTGNLLYNLGDRLYSYKLGTSELQPQLATDFPTVSADGLTYTIPLRQGVLFHDGAKFDAKAMEFSLQRFIKNGGSPAFLLSDLVQSVQATGAYELTIQLKQPFAAFPSLLAFSGLCPVSPQAYEIKEGSFKPDTVISTGPYKLVKYGTDQIRLDTFDQYWGTKPANQGIDIQFFSSSANVFNAFRTGAVDLAYQNLAVDQIRTLQAGAATQKWQAIAQAGSSIDYVTINLQSPPLDKLEVRQAIAAMMDRPLLEERVFRGQIEPLYSLIPNTLPMQDPVFKALGNGNAAKARTLLTQAGYSKTNPLKVEFWYRSNVVNDQWAALTLKAVVKKRLGELMQLDLRSVESTTAYKNLDKGVYPMFLLDWTPDFVDADNYIQPFMECTKGSEKTGCEEGSSFLQGSFYYSDRANQLIDQSRRELNPDIRKQLFKDLQNLLGEDVPFIPLWQSKDFLFAQQWIQGASLQITQKVPFWTLQK
jgi:peptide/nickel transport system substrate-binding protein